MNNLSSYCGLVDAKIRASDKNLPVCGIGYPVVETFIYGTGKSLSEVLIFASTNLQYDDRLFIELQVQYMKSPRPSSEHGENMLCTEIIFDIQNNLCTQHVLNMFWNLHILNL